VEHSLEILKIDANNRKAHYYLLKAYHLLKFHKKAKEWAVVYR